MLGSVMNTNRQLDLNGIAAVQTVISGGATFIVYSRRSGRIALKGLPRDISPPAIFTH